jgi:hypothetical protein
VRIEDYSVSIHYPSPEIAQTHFEGFDADALKELLLEFWRLRAEEASRNRRWQQAA